VYLDCHFTWNLHLENLIKKLSSICFLLRKLSSIVNVKTLRMAYFANFQSQINYGIIFWGSSSSMRNTFIIQERALRIMLRLGPRSSCREGFKKLDILTVPCLYIYVLMLFVVKNPKIYQTNISVHGRNSRQQDKLHVPSVRSSTIQRGVYYSSVKIFNHLPQNISKLHNNIHIFKTMFRNYLVKNAFYSIDVFLSRDCTS
jgi:hypothetical protein